MAPLRLSIPYFLFNKGVARGVSPLTEICGFRGRVPLKPLLKRAGAVSAARAKALISSKSSRREILA